MTTNLVGQSAPRLHCPQTRRNQTVAWFRFVAPKSLLTRSGPRATICEPWPIGGNCTQPNQDGNHAR